MLFVGILMSCNSNSKESLLKSYEKACQKGDAIAVTKIFNKMATCYPNDEDWTESEMLRIETASAVFEQKATEKALKQLGGVMDLINNDEKDDDDED